MPDLKLLGGVNVGDHPDWLTFSPDSKTVYVANAGSNSVSAVDIASRKEVARIPVGQVPKRTLPRFGNNSSPRRKRTWVEARRTAPPPA